MAESGHGYTDVHGFKRVFSHYFTSFKGDDQQDAHEFLSSLLTALNEETNSAPKFKKQSTIFEEAKLHHHGPEEISRKHLEYMG